MSAEAKVTEINDEIAAVALDVGRAGVAIYFARCLRVAHVCAEVIVGLLVIASQGAVLAACGRYMGWW